MLSLTKAKLIRDVADRAAVLATRVYAVRFGEEAWEAQNRAWARLDAAEIAVKQMEAPCPKN